MKNANKYKVQLSFKSLLKIFLIFSLTIEKLVLSNFKRKNMLKIKESKINSNNSFKYFLYWENC